MSDFAWATSGGILMDGAGDIATVTGYAELQSLVLSILKASAEDWQAYNLGANLEGFIGSLNTATVQSQIKRQISQSLSNVLSTGTYQVNTIALAGTIEIYVFVNGIAVVSGTITSDSVNITGI